MFRSLWSRLFVSYALVVFLSLLAAAVSLVYLLQGYQRQVALTRLSDVAVPLNFSVRQLREMGVSSGGLLSYVRTQADDLDVRVLLVSRSGIILNDTAIGGDLVGNHLALPAEQLTTDRQNMYRGRYISNDGRYWLFVALPLQDTARVSPSEITTLVVAQPDRPFTAAFVELLKQLVLASLIALAAAILVAFWISRSLVRPLSRITHASVEMARGQYDQQVPIEGPEELEELAVSFNRMASEVGRSRRLLRDFVANVSHELRTPLTAISGFVTALQDGTVTDPEGQRQALVTIGAESRRLQRLVAQLLDLSRIESGQMPLARQPVDLAALLSDSIEIFALRADETSIALRADFPSSLVVEGDPDRLEQVFNNLIDNALKYTPPGGSVTIHAAAGGGTATVDVADTGTGIPEEDLDLVFDRFYRVEKSRSGVGSGLGLSIVREIVRAHGGSIEVSSREGEGSTFSVTLPLKQAA